MKISFEGVPVRSPHHFESESVGYGRVANQIYHAIKRAGIDIKINDPNAPVRLQIDDPSFLHRENGRYNIGFTTHESSELNEFWEHNVKQMDEIWTMSDWIAECFDKYTTESSLVVPTCISEVFTPIERSTGGIFYFLHTGEPTPRKNGRLVLEAFLREFEDNPNVYLIFKSYGNTSIPGVNLYDNVLVVGEEFSNQQYRDLLYTAHCLVYPSTACGGGMMPLEAMATGMPVISTWEWADYKDFIALRLDSELVDTPEYIKSQATQLEGQVFLTTVDSIAAQMREMYDNYSVYREQAFAQSTVVSEEYNWDRVVRERVVPRLRKIEQMYFQ